MSAHVLRGGRLIDPTAGTDEVLDIRIEDGVVHSVAKHIPSDDANEVDASGLIVAPGFVDMHCHVREPGREDEETIATASAAAAAGGYTAICTMPNTDPVADSAAIVEKVWALGRDCGLVDVQPAGALSRRIAGETMADIGEMARSRAAVRLFTDDGGGVQNALFARRAMEYITAFDGIYAEHCEDASLAAGGQMHEGKVSAELGLRGIPSATEELMVERDIALARLTGCRLHVLHVSTAGTVAAIRRGKAEGVPITAEATPHHFTLTHEALRGYDPNTKVNPPLRAEGDRGAIIEGLRDGTIDAIATDHAPHSLEEKDVEFEYAPPGIVGLETALALTMTELVHPGHISIARAVELLSAAPARILGRPDHGGPVAPGRPANLVIFDANTAWTVDPSRFHSRSRNTPFGGRTVTGRVVHTFHRGRASMLDHNIIDGALV
jgi:dihydroorotase